MSHLDLLPADDIPDDILDRSLDDPELRARWPRDLAAMMDVAAQALEQSGAHDPRRLAAVVMRALGHYHGGRMYYLPRGDDLDRALRDKRMWDEYDGTRDSVQRMAARESLTEQQVYAILRRQRAAHRARVQPRLFDD